MDIEFRNVTITITKCDDAKDGYARLMDLLRPEHGVCAISTDTFVVVSNHGRDISDEHSTQELFPTENP